MHLVILKTKQWVKFEIFLRDDVSSNAVTSIVFGIKNFNLTMNNIVPRFCD